MKGRSEGVESRENAGWRVLTRAQACFTARRARGGSTPSGFAAIGACSRSFMNSAGWFSQHRGTLQCNRIRIEIWCSDSVRLQQQTNSRCPTVPKDKCEIERASVCNCLHGSLRVEGEGSCGKRSQITSCFQLHPRSGRRLATPTMVTLIKSGVTAV